MDNKPIIDFPDDNMPWEDKLDATKFGLPIAQGIWGRNSRYGNSLFFNDRKNYEDIEDWLLGKNKEHVFDPFLGIKPDGNDKTWHKAIDRQLKNYLTKRLNIAVGKILNRKYDFEISNIDPASVDAREDMAARLELAIEYKGWMDKLEKEVGVNTRPDGVSGGAVLPINRNEIDLFMELDYKTSEEIGMELGIKHHLRRNNWVSTRAEQAYFSFALGVSSVYVGMDENMFPYTESWHPGDIIAPRSPKPNFTELPYLAGVKYMTVAEFRKMFANEPGMTDAKMADIIKKYAKKSQMTTPQERDGRVDEDIDRIAMLLYNYRSTDVIAASEHTDQYGNKRLHFKNRNYFADEDGGADHKKFEEKYGESRRLHRKTYNTVYEGWWIINSDIPPLKHGPRAQSLRKRGNMSEDLMGFKVFAPNAWNGRIVSTGEQMIPMAKELQRYYLKIQQLVAKMIPTVIGIDLFALQKASLKWDGKDLSDQDKIEMYMRQHIFLYNSKDRYAPGSNYKPFHVEKQGTGDEIDKLLQLIQQALFDLDEVIGFTRPVAASDLPAGEGKATTEMQIEATDIALGYLYDADFRMNEEVCESMGILHPASVKANKDYYDRIFGRLKTGVTYSSVGFDKVDQGMHLKVRPSEKEWLTLYQQGEAAFAKGILSFSDTLLLREFESIKQARRFIMMRERQFNEQQMQNSASLQQQNQQTQNQSIQDKLAADMQLEDKKHANELEKQDGDRNTIMLEHDLEMERDLRNNLAKGSQESNKVAAQGLEDRKVEQIRAIVALQIAKINAKKKPAKTA